MNLIEFDKTVSEIFGQNEVQNCICYPLGVLANLYEKSWVDDWQKFKEIVNNPRVTADEIDELFANFLNIFCEFFSQAKSATKITQCECLLRAVTTITLLDNYLEFGSLQERCLAQIKEEFGAEYLQKISQIDREFTSQKLAENTLKIDQKSLPESLKIYIILKKWNDILHEKMVGNFRDFMQIATDFLGVEMSFNFYNIVLMAQKMVEEKLAKKVFGSSEIVVLCRALSPAFLQEFFGGKLLGLARLKMVGARVPEFCGLTTNSVITNLGGVSDKTRYAVRSSANIEDGKKLSFAGMFDSFLDVAAGDLSANILKVRQSAASPRVRAYCEKNNCQSPQMAVVIQEFSPPTLAGVWFGIDPENATIEWVRGCGEALVSGKITPQNLTVNSVDLASLPAEIREIVPEIFAIQQKVLANFAFLPDIEWCVADGELKILQLRPITQQINLSHCQKSDGDLCGIACSGGKVTGRVCYIAGEWEMRNFVAGDILLVDYTSPEYVEIMQKSKAIIGLHGGFLCHAGIVARELGIPCVTGLGDDVKEKLLNKTVEVDGDTGKITIIDN